MKDKYMNNQLIKTAEISAEFQTLGITDATLLRFLRRYEEAIRPGREELETEVRASDDPTATMRAWIRARMVNPLMARFASEDPNVQFPLDEKNQKNLTKYNTNQQVVASRKIERAKEWATALEHDYVEYPEFVYTMLRDISDKFDHRTISPPPQVATGALAGMLTHYIDTAEKSQGRFSRGGADENQDAELREELADATREKDAAKANFDAVEARRPLETADQATRDRWLTERQTAQVAFDVASRREKLLTAKYSKFGENMFDLYVVYSFDEKKESERQEAEQRNIVGRWREVPAVRVVNKDFPTEQAKTDFLGSAFRGCAVCVKEPWGYERYAITGPIWALMDETGQNGLMAIAMDGRRVRHMQNKDNREPFGFEREIRAWMNSHPEYDFTRESEIGYGRKSLAEWIGAAEASQISLTDPKTFVNLALQNQGGREQSLFMQKIVAMNEADFNRYVRSWLVESINRRNIQQAVNAIKLLLANRVRMFAALRASIDALGDFVSDENPAVFPLYLDYVAEKCERRPVFEQKAGMNAAKKALLISSLARCSGSLTPALREEVLKTEGVFDEYLGINTPMPFTGVEVMQLMKNLLKQPEKALQLIMKMHRQGQNIDGVAPALVQVIRKNPKLSATYAVYVRQGRFKEGEEAIATDRASTILYAGFLRSLARANRGVLQGLPPKIAEAVRTLNEHDRGGH
jgi:hypothetical protein